MSDSDLPKGKLFSRVYLERGKAQTDSARFRSRFGAKVAGITFNRSAAAKEIKLELGATVEKSGSTHIHYWYDSFINKASIRDLLDTITIIYNEIYGSNIETAKANYCAFVERAMREENLSYRLDEQAGVHFYVDEEFERSRAATLIGLSGSSLEAARNAFEDAHRAMLSQDTLAAVRRSFDAVENVFKQRFGVSRLGSSEVKSKLSPIISAAYSDRGVDAGNRLIAAFAEWTNAAHQFRHAPGNADPSPPPLDIAILMMSEAAAYLRWLLGLPT